MSFFVALGLSLLLSPLALRIGLATGLVDRPTPSSDPGRLAPLKIHPRPVSVLGGAAVTIAALLAPSFGRGGVPVTVAAATLVGFGTGLADDLRPLSPRIRIASLAGAGLLLVAGGFRFGSTGWVGALLLIALVVACANAVNLVDGQDGLAGGLAALASLGLHFAAGASASGIGLALAGGLAGFLVWNRPPARIFLGNGGAYAVGTLFAVLAAELSAVDGGRGVLVSALCLGIFAFELSTTIGRRLRRGRPLTSGDREHAYDVVARQLGSRARSTLVFCGLGALAVGAASVADVIPFALAAAVSATVVASGSLTGMTWLARRRDR
jgi:UDP-GlcNAc:undecaprenyl-phosphate GlcNAc-1-phosphate transferase